MEVVPLSAAPVASLAWQRNRRWSLTVVCKATFDLVPGEMTLSPTQECINEHDQRWEDDPARSVHTPGDLAPLKKRADVTLVGSAYARRGTQVASLVARLVVGTIDKSVEVFGERVWTGTGAEERAPFARMPLRYERAAGGAGTENPAGIRMTRGGPMPNLAPPGRGDRPPIPVVGFGPIASDWPPRKQALARAAGAPPIDASRTVPDTLDDDFFNLAPRDQRLLAIEPDQRIVLENLHRDHPSLATRLPGMRPQAFVERGGRPPEEVRFIADGLWIDTDRSICTVTWRGLVPLAYPREPGRVLVALAGAHERLAYEDVARRAPAVTSERAPAAAIGDPLSSTADDPPSFDPEDSFVETLAQRIPPEILALRQQRQAAALASAAQASPASTRPPAQTAPASTPHPPRTPPPAAPAAPAPPPVVAPPPQAPVHVVDEATHTDLFIVGEDRALFDASPAWLARARRPEPSSPAIAESVAPPPSSPLAAAPIPTPPVSVAPVAEPLDRGLLTASRPAPSSPTTLTASSERSPWATGIAPSAPAEEPAAPSPAKAERAAPPSEVVDLVWFDPACASRVRSRFRAIVDELDFEPLDPDHDLPVDDPAAARDRHHVFGVLTQAPAIDPQGVGRAMLEAVSARGRFTPPLVVVAGELRFPFDDVEVLKATAAAAAPLAKDDKRLTDLLAAVDQVVGTPLAQGNAGPVEGLLRDLRDALAQNKRPWSAKVLDAHVERTLLTERTYQKRTVFGEPCVRTLLGTGREGGVPCYLPASVADRLPLVAQMKVKLLVEAHPSQDQYESHPHALRVVALGRVVPLDGLRVR